MNSIEINNISKSFGSKKALQTINLNVEAGEVFGLIGADGAGKSTLFDILVTLSKSDSGTARIEGLDVEKDYKKIRKIVGYMPGRFSLYMDLTVYENLDFFASIFGGTIEDNYELIKDIWVQIEPFKDRPAGKLSGGMKQKLALCCALVHQPRVLFLDEPTTGVDPVSRNEFWNMLKNLKRKGITILVSTPYMDEAILCERIALMQEGKIMAIDTPSNITKAFNKPLFSVKSTHQRKLINTLRRFDQAYSCYFFGQSVHLAAKNESVSAKEISDYLNENGHPEIQVAKISAGIEDCFIELMRKTA
ncbi:MAG: ABC transporter ATP-binding protein [Calditrichaeota bacterium]|nr:MAG: ABC transporter ATP-binding protein [Calditrichota bacterium]